DLLKELGKSLKKKVIITIKTDPNEVFLEALTDQYDIVAMDFNKDLFFSNLLTLSVPHSYSYPVIIERKNQKWDPAKIHQLYIPAKFSIDIDLNLLSDSKHWELTHGDDCTTEELFERLQKNEVDYIISDYNLAITLLPFYPELKIRDKVGNNFERTWTLNSNKPALNDTINQWLEEYKQSISYKLLCKKYLSQHSPIIYHSFKKSKAYYISPYDKIIKKYAKQYGIDWLFVSSIIFQETKFESKLTGLGGSFGLMQMMPETGNRYGISDTSTVEEQIKAGTKHLAFLQKRYQEVKSPDEILYFVAASYNAGTGHIQDAQSLCEKHGKDPWIWRHVAHYLKLKSQKKYYYDPVVRCGYFPGKYTVQYANQVVERYKTYKVTLEK
ncbi:MAG: transglycosylase SLT domain-containing protein, partial [Bacteroidales bacterium]